MYFFPLIQICIYHMNGQFRWKYLTAKYCSSTKRSFDDTSQKKKKKTNLIWLQVEKEIQRNSSVYLSFFKEFLQMHSSPTMKQCSQTSKRNHGPICTSD